MQLVVGVLMKSQCKI